MVEPPVCPLCEETGSDLYLWIRGCELRCCRGCGLITTAPFLTPQEIAGLYNEKYYSNDQEARRFRWNLAETLMRAFRYRRAQRIRQSLGEPTGKRILDIGCGRGYTLSLLKRWGYEVHGTQISGSAVQFARERLGLSTVFHGDLLSAGYPQNHFDFISMVHVLEHLQDPRPQLREIARILRPEGFLYVEVPNAGSLPARWLKASWLAYDVPRHRLHFTPVTLRKLMEKEGFTCVRRGFFSLEYSPATVLFSLLNTLFGHKGTLFEYLSGESDSDKSRRPISKGRVMGQVAAAALLALPALTLSLLLWPLRQGDTMAFTFKKCLNPSFPSRKGTNLSAVPAATASR